jgi:hypothetical protein
MYAYRHGLELYLKCILRSSDRTYNLGSLFENLCEHVVNCYNEQVPSWISKLILEFDRYDPVSDVFRYEESRSTRLRNEGELWIDLIRLRRTMTGVHEVLKRIAMAERVEE